MSESDLTPEEQQVRRLLADARHDAPVPADVATRLDAVLADLVAEQQPRRTPAPVDLAAARRRRRARNVLIAAAAVVVVGVGISRADLTTSSNDAGGSSSAADSAEQESTADGPATASRPALRRTPELTAGNFERRVRALIPLSGATAYAGPSSDLGSEQSAPAEDRVNALVDGCDSGAWGRGTRIYVTYDGQPGTLVLRKPSGDSREVDLYLCDGTTPVRTVTVPAG